MRHPAGTNYSYLPAALVGRRGRIHAACIMVLLPALVLSVISLPHAHADAAGPTACDVRQELFWEGQATRCSDFIYEPVGPHECEVFPYGVVSFFPAEPLNHTIEGGEFVTLCVSPEYYWFDVFLHTHSPGSLTVEIPKDIIDLKQFDFPRCLSPGNVLVRDGYDTPPGSVTVSQVSQAEHSRTLLIVWDYPGVEKISYIGADLGTCISKQGEGTYDPPEYGRDGNFGLNAAESVCDDFRRHIKMDFAHNITTGSVETMCLNKKALEVVLDVEEGGHLLLNIPNGLFSKDAFGVSVSVGDSEYFDGELYRLLVRDPRLEHRLSFPPEPSADDRYAIITSYPRVFYSVVMDYYGHISASQIDIVVHSINADSITYRIPFLKDDAAFVLSDGSIFVRGSSEYERDPSQLKRMIEKYAVPSELPPPRVQAYITGQLDIVCRDSLVQVIKNSAPRIIETGNGILRQPGMPIAVCIKPSSVDVFMERGLIVIPDEMGGLAPTEDGSSTQAWMNGSDSRSKQW